MLERRQCLLGATIKAPAAKSRVFLIGASLQTGILTGSQIAGGTGKQSSTATGSIVVTPEVTYGPHGKKVRVWPPAVTFDERSQTLTANLSGCLTNLDSTTGLPVVSCTEPETIGLILSTLSAHSFNFLAENVGSGVYTVKLNIGATATATSSSIAAKSQVGVANPFGTPSVRSAYFRWRVWRGTRTPAGLSRSASSDTPEGPSWWR